MICSHCGHEGALLRTEDGRYWHPLCVVEIRRAAGRVEAKPKPKQKKLFDKNQSNRR